jgi:hypothetical protein
VENFKNNYGEEEEIMNSKIQNMPNILQDSWKLHQACNNVSGCKNGKEDSSSRGKAPEGIHSPISQLVGLGERGSNLGGLFKGPIIAEVEKSICEAQEGGRRKSTDLKMGFVSMPSKQKHMEEPYELSGGQNLSKGHQKKRVDEGGKKGEGVNVENIQNGLGMAEAGTQPRRPQ